MFAPGESFTDDSANYSSDDAPPYSPIPEEPTPPPAPAPYRSRQKPDALALAAETLAKHHAYRDLVSEYLESIRGKKELPVWQDITSEQYNANVLHIMNSGHSDAGDIAGGLHAPHPEILPDHAYDLITRDDVNVMRSLPFIVHARNVYTTYFYAWNHLAPKFSHIDNFEKGVSLLELHNIIVKGFGDQDMRHCFKWRVNDGDKGCLELSYGLDQNRTYFVCYVFPFCHIDLKSVPENIPHEEIDFWEVAQHVDNTILIRPPAFIYFFPCRCIVAMRRKYNCSCTDPFPNDPTIE